MNHCDVAIIGAGPYGLSLAAHLKAAGVSFRIFGSPMEFWWKHMPEGMHLKSEGFASSLYDPGARFRLEAYCKERGQPYADIGSPVPLEVFASYGMEFQRRFVPQLEPQRVTSVKNSSRGFEVTLDSGEVFSARRVVVAVGLTYFAYLPPELASLPQELVTHSSQHSALEKFKGRSVAVVGAGASALDLAALLHQAGASVQVIARVPKLRFQDPPDNLHPSWLDQMRDPVTGIGVGWRLYACANLPLAFRMMPEQFRIEKVRKTLGPAPCWFTREQVVGKVGMTLGAKIERASVHGGQVLLELSDDAGTRTEFEADHVIAGTGYRCDVRRLAFLAPDIVNGIRCVGNSPALSTKFESTVKNLFFVGVTAANTFGPLLRFAFGAGFAAPRLSRHLARTASAASRARGTVSKTESNRECETAERAAR
jgi:lysine/ornithine N-monooxygenase